MNREPLDDASIAQLVHEVADDWTLPPVRLDAPTWRERIRSPRARRVEAARGWFARVGQAATAAVALAVAGALIAAVITSPPGDPGNSAEPSDPATPRATDAARATPLPRLDARGDVPSPGKFPVRTDGGDFAVVDLGAGTIGPSFTGGRFGSELQVRSDGTYVCLCVDASGSAGGSPTTATVRLDHYAADGTLTSSMPIETFEGVQDPRDVGTFLPARPPNVLTAMSFSEGDRFGFVGWSLRDGNVWQSGVLVVELRTGTIFDRLDLPLVTMGEANARRVLEAPRVVGSAEGALIIGRAWYEFSPPEAEDARYTFDVDAHRVGFAAAAGTFGAVTVVSVEGCGDAIRFGGGLPDDGTWVVCTRGGTLETVLRRVPTDRSVLPDISVMGAVGIEGDTAALSRDGRVLFVWDPASARMTRIDIETGITTTGDGLVARSGGGPLAELGHWLAPAAAAKSFLQSAVVVSPDGSRVYALGVKDGVDGPESTGSAGVFAFDAATLEPVGLYAPTADFVSLAIGFDGRFVYAAGEPGYDALGSPRGDQGASITVFDTVDGSQRVIAGQLGNRRLSFLPGPLG